MNKQNLFLSPYLIALTGAIAPAIAGVLYTQIGAMIFVLIGVFMLIGLFMTMSSRTMIRQNLAKAKPVR